MIEKSGRRGRCIFSQPKFYIFFVNHGGKICSILVLFMFSVAIVANRGSEFLYRLTQGVIVLSILIYFTGRILRKFAYKIVVDFEARKIKFHMNRSSDIIVTGFDNIESIRVNAYIIFILKNKKVFYSGAASNEILACLNKIMKIDWGVLCALLGPSKNVRHALQKESQVEI